MLRWCQKQYLKTKFTVKTLFFYLTVSITEFRAGDGMTSSSDGMDEEVNTDGALSAYDDVNPKAG
jgi:hypothetical protein